MSPLLSHGVTTFVVFVHGRLVILPNKPGVHIIAMIATIAQKELCDETVRSAIAITTIAEIEDALSRRTWQSCNCLHGNMQASSIAELSYSDSSDRNDYMDTRL